MVFVILEESHSLADFKNIRANVFEENCIFRTLKQTVVQSQ